MTILIELEPFSKPAIGKNIFSAARQQAVDKNLASHPVFDWVKTASIDGPTLVFDLNTVEERMRWLAELTSTFSVVPLLAVKSCTDSTFLNLASQYLGGCDVSNMAEYSCLPEDMRGQLVSVTSPVLPDNLARFREKGNDVVVTLDSHVQVDQFLAQGCPCDYMLRIQAPDLLKNASPPDLAYYPYTRFGFTVDEVISLIDDSRLKAVLPAGFHVHHGSEMNKSSTYKTIINELSELAKRWGNPVKYLNLGGGWHKLDQDEITGILVNARSHFSSACSVLLEPGRWYAKTAGFAVGKVVNISSSRGIVRCTLDVSARSHLNWSTPTLLHLTESHHEKAGIVHFFGPSCYEADFIGKYFLPYSTDLIGDAGLSIGKYVVFGDVSTYSMEWNTSFNGIPAADTKWVSL